ncbi:MAG: hypothetical protein JSS36_03515 [Proteobacteria bacterium]|nr:hypothetical protein [Pseudomonadota bacterium]
MAVNRMAGYRIAVPTAKLAVAINVGAVLVGAALQPRSWLLPQCFGKAARYTSLPSFIGTFWACPEGFRLSILSLLATSLVLALTLAGRRVASHQRETAAYASVGLRCLLAGLTVGTMYLVGVYYSEYFGGQGKANPWFVAGTPILASLIHFPGKPALVAAVPVFVFGVAGLILLAMVTGIPLD